MLQELQVEADVHLVEDKGISTMAGGVCEKARFAEGLQKSISVPRCLCASQMQNIKPTCSVFPWPHWMVLDVFIQD